MVMREDTAHFRTSPARQRDQIPLIGMAQAGQQVDFEDVVDWEELIRIPNDDPKAIAIRVRGDSMEPLIHERDIVIVAPSYPPSNGKPVVARTKAGVVVKFYRMLPGDRIELASANEIYKPITVQLRDLVWIYPVTTIIHFT